MRKISKVMEEYLILFIDNFVLLSGIGLFIYGLFSFDSGRYCGEGALKKIIDGSSLGLGKIEHFKCIDPTTFYFYDSVSLRLLTVGAIFIVMGLLKLRKYERKN